MIDKKEVENMAKMAIGNHLATYDIVVSANKRRAIVFVKDQLTNKEVYRVAFGFSDDQDYNASTFYLDVAPLDKLAEGYEEIVNQLAVIISDWFKKQLYEKPKYNLHVLPGVYGYLAYDKLANMYQITSLKIAKENHMLVEFTQAEIDKMDDPSNGELEFILVDESKEKVEG